jgi:hypothetical protein
MALLLLIQSDPGTEKQKKRIDATTIVRCFLIKGFKYCVLQQLLEEILLLASKSPNITP